MTATQATNALAERLSHRGIVISFEDANALRRAERTLHTWGEQECGDGSDQASWAIERDDTNGKPYRCVYPHSGKSYRTPIADKEKGALKRVADICKRNNIHFYHQTDPRGCALYVSLEPLDAQSYTNGVACCM